MNAQIVSKENNTVKFTFEAGPEKFEEGLQYSYKKNKGRIVVPGFRKGKAPRQVIESQFGVETLYEDAINFVLNTEYEIAIKELGLDVVSRPDIDVSDIGKRKGIFFEAEVTIKPEVSLGQYKGIEVEKQSDTVSDEDVLAELDKIREQNSRTTTVTDRAAQMGDVVNISYRGTVDGIPFEGGTAGSFDLTLGSKSFIDTFEEQIVGHVSGDKFDVNVTFPEQYHEPSLAGKAAIFAVELKEISFKELPELNDELAQDASEFDTLDEYKASIMDRLKEEKTTKARQLRGDKILDKAIENAQVEVPEIMFENKIDQLMRDFEENMNRQGLGIDMYCQITGKSKEEVRETFTETAKKSVYARLILEAVSKAENIVVSTEEVDAEIKKYGEESGIDGEKMLEYFQDSDREALMSDMAVHKALELMQETAIDI